MNEQIRGTSFNSVFNSACSHVLAGIETEPRGMKIREQLDMTLLLTNPYNRILSIPGRDISLRYLAGELCFYFSGSDKLKDIVHYSKFWKKVSDDGIHVNSNYGQRLFYDKVTSLNSISQFWYCANCLYYDKDSRKAVAFLYYPEQHSRNSKDNPCTMDVQFLIRENRLNMIVNMRSNDLWFGTTYDIPFFTLVQEMMLVVSRRAYPHLKMGWYAHHVGSLHLYERNWAQAQECANSIPGYNKDMCIPVIKSIKEIGEIQKLIRFEKAYRTLGPETPRFSTSAKWLQQIAVWLTEEK